MKVIQVFLLILFLLFLFLDDLFWSLMGFVFVYGIINVVVVDAMDVNDNIDIVFMVEMVMGEGSMVEGVSMGKVDDKV